MSLRHHPTRRRPHWVILSSEISERTDYELRRENGGSGRRLERGGSSDRTAAQRFRSRTGDTYDKRHGRGQTDRCSRKATRLATGQRAPVEGHADGTADGPYEQRNEDQSATPRHHADDGITQPQSVGPLSASWPFPLRWLGEIRRVLSCPFLTSARESWPDLCN